MERRFEELVAPHRVLCCPPRRRVQRGENQQQKFSWALASQREVLFIVRPSLYISWQREANGHQSCPRYSRRQSAPGETTGDRGKSQKQNTIAPVRSGRRGELSLSLKHRLLHKLYISPPHFDSILGCGFFDDESAPNHYAIVGVNFLYFARSRLELGLRPC